jgi:hypothetical protein
MGHWNDMLLIDLCKRTYFQPEYQCAEVEETGWYAEMKQKDLFVEMREKHW